MADQEENKAPAEMPVARIVSPKEREKFVDLDYPVEFDGVVYEKIRIQRITGKELEDYFDSLGTGKAFQIPPVVDCPVEVWDAMDADDQDSVDVVARAFMPRRLKAAAKLLGVPGEASSGS